VKRLSVLAAEDEPVILVSRTPGETLRLALASRSGPGTLIRLVPSEPELEVYGTRGPPVQPVSPDAVDRRGHSPCRQGAPGQLRDGSHSLARMSGSSSGPSIARYLS
jgi:hypothetical protein